MCALPVAKLTFKQYIYEIIKQVCMKEYVTSAPNVRSPLSRSPTGIDMNYNVLEPTTAAMTVIKISQVYNS